MMRQATPPRVEFEYLEGSLSCKMLSLDRTLVDAPRKRLWSPKAFWVMPWGMLSAVNKMTHFSEKAKPTACFQHLASTIGILPLSKMSPLSPLPSKEIRQKPLDT
ncbi:hypothetical protein MC885_019087 [Smutsia gigantea]|nr:hypothetical protein MC885_019087 [Smutsia gigantea]